MHMVAVMQLACFTNEFAWAHACVREGWQRYERSPLRRSAHLTMLARMTRARLLLNEYVYGGCEGELPAELRHQLKLLRGSPAKLAITANRLDARILRMRGDHAGAQAILRELIASFTKENAPAEAAIDRCALGTLVEGQNCAEVQRAEADLRRMGMVNPRNFVRAYYPELFPGG